MKENGKKNITLAKETENGKMLAEKDLVNVIYERLRRERKGER